MLGETSTQGVGPRDDNAVVHAQLEEGIANCSDFGEEVCVGHGNLTVLMAALLLVGHLILDLDGTGPRLDHLLGQQVCCLCVAKPSINVGNDRHHMGLKLINVLGKALHFDLVPGLFRRVQLAEQAAKFASVSLSKKGVKFLDEPRHRGLLVHRLVGQRAEIRAKCRYHPAG